MAKPATPSVPLEVWRAAFEQMLAFRKAEPWRDVPDSAISTYVDGSGEPWFACILGKAGQVFGLCLYRGAIGLRFHRLVQEQGPDFDPTEHLREQDALTFYLGTKSELPPPNRDVYRALGYAPKAGDRLAWPAIRSHKPGLLPWVPDEQELRVLAAAIPGVLRFAEYYRQHPDCFQEHGEWDLPSVPSGGSGVPASLEWRTWLTPPPPPIGPPIAVDPAAAAVKRAAALRQADEVLEVDWLYTDEAVAEKGRPFYPRCVAVFRSHGGYCYGADLIGPTEDAAAKAAAMIFDAVAELGARPRMIVVKKPELAVRLAPAAAALKAEVIAVGFLPAATEFRQGLRAQTGGGRPPPRGRR